MGLDVDEIKRHTQMIADMQRDIEDEERLAGSFHHNLYQYADDGIFNAAAKQAAVQNKLEEKKAMRQRQPVRVDAESPEGEEVRVQRYVSYQSRVSGSFDSSFKNVFSYRLK